jgi:archaellum component FlaC
LAPIDTPDRPLQSGGGGGTFDGMEARVAILETHVEYIRRDIGELKADVSEIRRDLSGMKDDFKSDVEGVKVQLATLTERVNHLPSKGFIVTATLSSLSAIAALIMFQDHIKAFFTH